MAGKNLSGERMKQPTDMVILVQKIKRPNGQVVESRKIMYRRFAELELIYGKENGKSVISAKIMELPKSKINPHFDWRD